MVYIRENKPSPLPEIVTYETPDDEVRLRFVKIDFADRFVEWWSEEGYKQFLQYENN